MEYFCTTCCREKQREPELLPALERYLDPRIAAVHARSLGAGKPFVILSGKFGLVGPRKVIPYYDQALGMADVEKMQVVVARQLRELNCTGLRFFGLPRTTFGWEPYFQVIEGGCHQAGVDLQIVIMLGE